MKNNLILLVEDNHLDEILTLRSLAQGKVDNVTHVVRDGQEALDYLFYEGLYADRPIGNPEIILLDLGLPKVDGAEVLKKIRSHESTKLIPVIILTASKEEDDKARSFKDGANRYMEKPVNTDLFNKTMQEFLLYWVKLNKDFV